MSLQFIDEGYLIIELEFEPRSAGFKASVLSCNIALCLSSGRSAQVFCGACTGVRDFRLRALTSMFVFPYPSLSCNRWTLELQGLDCMALLWARLCRPLLSTSLVNTGWQLLLLTVYCFLLYLTDAVNDPYLRARQYQVWFSLCSCPLSFGCVYSILAEKKNL